MDIGYSEVVATLALGLSFHSMRKSTKFNDHQKQINQNQDALNKRLLAKEEKELLESKKADIGANLIKLGQNKYRLKIFNAGNNTARNVYVEFPDGNDFVLEQEIDQKLPYESLEPRAVVELVADPFFHGKSKFNLVLKWEDDYRNYNSKPVVVSV